MTKKQLEEKIQEYEEQIKTLTEENAELSYEVDKLCSVLDGMEDPYEKYYKDLSIDDIISKMQNLIPKVDTDIEEDILKYCIKMMEVYKTASAYEIPDSYPLPTSNIVEAMYHTFPAIHYKEDDITSQAINFLYPSDICDICNKYFKPLSKCLHKLGLQHFDMNKYYKNGTCPYITNNLTKEINKHIIKGHSCLHVNAGSGQFAKTFNLNGIPSIVCEEEDWQGDMYTEVNTLNYEEAIKKYGKDVKYVVLHTIYRSHRESHDLIPKILDVISEVNDNLKLFTIFNPSYLPEEFIKKYAYDIPTMTKFYKTGAFVSEYKYSPYYPGVFTCKPNKKNKLG